MLNFGFLASYSRTFSCSDHTGFLFILIFCWQAVLNDCGWWVCGREIRGTSASSQSHRLSNHTSSSLVSLRHSIPVHQTHPECECRKITTTATNVLKIICLVVVFAECFDVFVSRIIATEGHAVAQLVEALRHKP